MYVGRCMSHVTFMWFIFTESQIGYDDTEKEGTYTTHSNTVFCMTEDKNRLQIRRNFREIEKSQQTGSPRLGIAFI